MALSKHIITLSSQRSWNANDPVYLFGTEVIGALEHRSNGYTLTGVLNSSGNAYFVTANDPDLCRMVIFYEDGIPQEPDYDPPFEYNSNGGSVTAKLYSRFASETPVIEATIDVANPILPPDPPESLRIIN